MDSEKQTKQEIYQNLLESVCERWKKTGLLNGLKEETQADVAMVLENQRLANAATDENAHFKRLSIPAIRRILGGLSESKTIIAVPYEMPDAWVSVGKFVGFDESGSGSQNTLNYEAENLALLCMEAVEQLRKLPGETAYVYGLRIKGKTTFLNGDLEINISTELG